MTAGKLPDLAAAQETIARLTAELAEARTANVHDAPVWARIDAIAEKVADSVEANEARIQAAERARTERDIAAHCRTEAKRNEDSANRGRHSDAKFANVLDGAAIGMTAIAERIEAGDYPRLPEGSPKADDGGTR